MEVLGSLSLIRDDETCRLAPVLSVGITQVGLQCLAILKRMSLRIRLMLVLRYRLSGSCVM